VAHLFCNRLDRRGRILNCIQGLVHVAIINAIATSAAFVWGAPWRQGEALRSFRSIQRAVLAIGLGIVLLSFVFPDAFLSRLAIYEETLRRIARQTN